MDGFDLLVVSRVFSCITIQNHQFFGIQSSLWAMYMTPGKTIPFSRESSLPKDQTQVPFQGDSLPSEPQEAPFHIHGKALKISNLRSLFSVISSNLLMFDYKMFFFSKNSYICWLFFLLKQFFTISEKLSPRL